MAITETYAAVEPSRADIDANQGPLLLEFGAPWCGFCQAAQMPLEEAMAAHPRVAHIKVEDGKGKRLGRTFGVKLWPTLVFLQGGTEVTRLVRPEDVDEIRQALSLIDGGCW